MWAGGRLGFAWSYRTIEHPEMGAWPCQTPTGMGENPDDGINFSSQGNLIISDMNIPDMSWLCHRSEEVVA